MGGTGARWEGGRVLDGIQLSAETKVRLFRSDSIRYDVFCDTVYALNCGECDFVGW